MSKSVYLVNPATGFSGYYTAEVFAANGLTAVAATADLATTTIAALAPSDFCIEVVEEYITPVDFDTSADYVGITGKITQWTRMKEIATEFRKRGKVVIFGGPHASLSPEVVRPYCDILVRGEVEEIAPDLFSDLRSGNWKAEYQGEKPDLRLSPIPRWDLYPNDRAILGALQTSRGCPFECDFCDVIQYAGRKQRHKPVGQVLSELDELQRHRYRVVFLADDNFTVYRQRCRELLTALRDWNRRQTQGELFFTTQVSIDAAKDEPLLHLCADANVSSFFVGIETPNEDSLKASKKRQNVNVDLLQGVTTMVESGITVMAGMIVGFDNDDVSIFQRQYEFAMASPIPIFSLGALVAPAATPLRERLRKEGRLVSDGSEVAAMPWATNIVPTSMSAEELLSGLRWLCNRLYEPGAFGERVIRFMDTHGKRRDPGAWNRKTSPTPRPSELDGEKLLSRIGRLGASEADMLDRLKRHARRKPHLWPTVAGMLRHYMQIRHMYELGCFWEPMLGSSKQPSQNLFQPIRVVAGAR